MDLFKAFVSSVRSSLPWISDYLASDRGPVERGERDDLVEERQELGYTSHFEGNSRKRRRPTPTEEDSQTGLRAVQPSLVAKFPIPASSYHDTPASDLSAISSPERPSPSTNATEPPSDVVTSNSIIDFAEAKWKEHAATSYYPIASQRRRLNPSQQLKKNLAKRSRHSDHTAFRYSHYTDRVSKRSSTPGSLRASLQRRTPLADVTREPRNTTLSEPSPHIWQDPRQFSPSTTILPQNSPLRHSTRSSTFATPKPKSAFLGPSRSARIQREIDIKSASKKPWLRQQEPDAVLADPEGLANLIKELQENKVEGFENYNQVQERQKRINERLRELREPKVEALRDISEPSLQDLHDFLGHRNQNYEVRLIGGCPVTPRNLKTLSGSQWLNDEVINGYIHLVKQRANADGKTHLILLNSMFVTTLKDHGYSRVSRWTKRAGAGGEKVLSLDGVVIPIHRNFHWTLAYINISQKKFEYYDSLAGDWDPISLLRDYMKHEIGPKYIDSEWADYYPRERTPQQQNGVDCGVFLCKTAEVICRNGILSFSQKDIPKIRRMMQVELLKGDLAAV